MSPGGPFLLPGFARRRYAALRASLASSAYWHIRLRVSLARRLA